ncbi:unnamed protein product, partial [Closterium sp. NIES-54]
RANDIRAANTTPRRPTLSKPLTKLLGQRGLAPTLLLLPLVTARTSPLNISTLTATTPTAATTATPIAATIAATEAPTPATTPTAATTSATSTTSTAATTTTPAATATTPTTLSLADAALPTSRSSPDILSTMDVNSSTRGLHLPSFSTNLVSTAALQDAMVTTTTPGGQRVSICTCTQMGRHLATGRPGSSLYTLTTEPAQVAAFAQVSASGPVVAPSSCHLLSHQTLLWHHRLGHPSLPRLRGMHSRFLASGLS